MRCKFLRSKYRNVFFSFQKYVMGQFYILMEFEYSKCIKFLYFVYNFKHDQYYIKYI